MVALLYQSNAYSLSGKACNRNGHKNNMISLDKSTTDNLVRTFMQSTGHG